MSNQVYANGNEVSCKAADGKTICAMPDVCMTPPQTPATPPGVPVPYPNTGVASDCTDGSSTVKISGQEAMLKNKSYFKRSTGDEAGSAPMKGVVTHTNTGKVYFIVWSMDIKIEGENVVRHLDMTTGNHACPTANEAAPFTYAQRMAMAKGLDACDDDRERVRQDCGIDPDSKADGKKRPDCPSADGIRDAEADRADVKKEAKKRFPGKTGFKKDPEYKKANKKVTKEYEKFAKKIEKDDCHTALKCFLVPQTPKRCCYGQTPHHLIPASGIVEEGGRGKKGGENVLAAFKGYKSSKAPCICVEGPNADTATHMEAHTAWADHLSGQPDTEGSLKYVKGKAKPKQPTITYTQASEGAQLSAEAVADHCDPACIQAQLDREHLKKKKASKADGNIKMRRTMDRDDMLDGAGEA